MGGEQGLLGAPLRLLPGHYPRLGSPSSSLSSFPRGQTLHYRVRSNHVPFPYPKRKVHQGQKGAGR